MKFYVVTNDYTIEDEKGIWATRADAEQAVKDAVEMAKEMQQTHD